MIMSHRFANPKDASVGACPLDDPGSSCKQEPPLTLSQMLQNSRSELNKRNTETITKFIVEHVEPLLREQALSGLSKTEYCFIPSGIEQAKLDNIMPANKNIVEGFAGSEKSGPYISDFSTKEYVKMIRLIKLEYSLEFWQQPAIVKELGEALKKRLHANGEKLADTTGDSTGRPWWRRSFIDGENLSPGHTGVELVFLPTYTTADPTYGKVLYLFVEIA